MTHSTTAAVTRATGGCLHRSTLVTADHPLADSRGHRGAMEEAMDLLRWVAQEATVLSGNLADGWVDACDRKAAETPLLIHICPSRANEHEKRLADTGRNSKSHRARF